MDHGDFLELSLHMDGVLKMVDAAAEPKRLDNVNINYDVLLDAAVGAWLKVYPDSPVKKIKGIV